MVWRLLQPVRYSSLFHRVSRRWRCTISADPDPYPYPYPSSCIHESGDEAVFVAAGRADYRIIDKSGKSKPYIPPWSAKPYRNTNNNLDQKIFLHNGVSNSCDGMMLFPFNDSIFLFNPETKYFQKVLQLDYYKFFSRRDYESTLGLCFDPSINDYKALLYFRHYNRDVGWFVAQASLKGKKWTTVDFPFDFYDVQKGPVINGCIHWTAHLPDADCEENYIARFNPVSNAFDILPSPPTEHKSENVIMGLQVMDGCLWMTRWRVVNMVFITGEVEVFKMKEYGVAESWTLMYVLSYVPIDVDAKSMDPLLIMDNGRVLFSKSCNDNIMSGETWVYDPETNWGEAHCTTPSPCPVSVPFVKNLSSPVGYNWDPIQHQHFGQLNPDSH